jgi:hypothetical protein
VNGTARQKTLNAWAGNRNGEETAYEKDMDDDPVYDNDLLHSSLRRKQREHQRGGRRLDELCLYAAGWPDDLYRKPGKGWELSGTKSKTALSES